MSKMSQQSYHHHVVQATTKNRVRARVRVGVRARARVRATIRVNFNVRGGISRLGLQLWVRAGLWVRVRVSV